MLSTAVAFALVSPAQAYSAIAVVYYANCVPPANEIPLAIRRWIRGDFEQDPGEMLVLISREEGRFRKDGDAKYCAFNKSMMADFLKLSQGWWEALPQRLK
jgi:hypothetical protein